MNDHVHILWKFSAYEIQRFTGSDIAGILHTGNMIQFQSGLILKETLLGWTLSWKTDKVEISGITYCVMPLQVNDAKISDLWHTRHTFGVLYPKEKNSWKEIEVAAESHFNWSIQCNVQERLEVNCLGYKVILRYALVEISQNED